MHPMVHLHDEAQVVAHFGPFGDSLILTQDRCIVCVERSIGSEVILVARVDVGHVESHFSPFGGSVSVSAR